ncbi:XylR N-terminal domain-containing protein [Alicyclobacillus dauci]|uniref:XylR N-terminal domain-containing protein n=1 Tax=Alicyclobacillus dauci TaxID=1475485 RepID=A0ABY6YZ62_9BACL|nr:XylR N-terminal domain-containing protein [Alicyclobacillus dauci]WAH35593.1 XylR N-terminal domain-containing protein [Alicyclobacillus dauci]
MMNNAKIKDLLNIDPVTKKIHLHDKRIVLMETDALGELRKDLISALGMDRAKGFLLRYGWNCGSNYAKIFKTVMPSNSDRDWMHAGPEIHEITGEVTVEIKELRFNPVTKEYYSEGYWNHSYEAEQHLNYYGYHHESVCFTLRGYAGGYVSQHLGRKIIFKEIECIGKGDSHCRWVAKPIEDWGEDIKDELPFYQEENLAQELDKAYIRIEHQNEMFQKMLRIDDQLSSALLRRKGLVSIINVVGKHLNNTVVIEDRDFGLFESYGHYTEHDFSKFLKEHTHEDEEMRNRLIQQRRTVQFSVPPQFGWQHKRLISPVIVDNEVWGHISLIKKDGNFNEMEVMCLERASTICAIQLLNERISIETEQRIKGEFLDAILNGDRSIENLSRQMKVLGYNLNRPHYVFVFSFIFPDKDLYKGVERYLDEFPRQLSSIIITQFKSIGENLLISSKLDQVVVLIPKDIPGIVNLEPRETGQLLVSKLSEKYSDFDITVGISSLCYCIDDYKRGYEEAKKAIKLSRFYNSTSKVVPFADLGFISYLSSGENFDDVKQFCMNLLGKLVTYDIQNNSELTRTLYYYLESQGNILKTSRTMNMSAGSIKYRLKRIEDISGLNLSESSDFFDAHLALKILQYSAVVEF